MAGDLNKAEGPRGGGWLSKALGPKGPLAGFRAPYGPGDPANVVWQVGHPSERELDWVLMGPETPCVGGGKGSCSPVSAPTGWCHATWGSRNASSRPPPLPLVPTQARAASARGSGGLVGPVEVNPRPPDPRWDGPRGVGRPRGPVALPEGFLAPPRPGRVRAA